MHTPYYNVPVLVTGGAGFIGSPLVKKLVELGAQVTVLDNLSTGSKDNLTQVLERITFIEGDITNYTTCLNACTGNLIIFHLAAFISVPLSVAQPRTCHDVNVTGTVNMLEAARVCGARRFVFSSSAAVYGNTNGVCTETMATKPASPYGFSKLMGELYCQQYCINSSLETVALRYFNVIGNGQSGSGPYPAVYTAFKQKMEKNESVTMFGDGLQTRDFVPVSQVVAANIASGIAPKEHLHHAVYNVATGTSTTLLELFNSLKKAYPDYKKPIIFAPARPGDVHHSQGDCSRLQTLLQSPLVL